MLDVRHGRLLRRELLDDAAHDLADDGFETVNNGYVMKSGNTQNIIPSSEGRRRSRD